MTQKSKGKILVTGGLGYIGSHTVLELSKAGFEPVIIDDQSNSEQSTLRRLSMLIEKKPLFYKYNITNFRHLEKVFDENELQAVIHFAASKAVGESVKNPLLYYGNNISGTVSLLEAMRSYAVKKIIFSSSCTVYGEPEKLPVTEMSPIKPANSPYGNTKQICEEIISDTVTADPQLKAISLRYFNPIGSHESGLIGELPKGIPNNLVPYLLKVASGQLHKLSVFGDDYNTPDGTAVRDYIHVVDLARAHVAALNRLTAGEEKDRYEYFNLGTGTGYSVLELINTFQEVTGVKVAYQIVERRQGDIEKIFADTTKANNVLGWRADLGLGEMLRSAWKWQLNLLADI